MLFLSGLLLSLLLTANPPAPPGVVFVIGGVGGFDPLGVVARLALPAAGVPHEVRDFVWTHGRGLLFRDLQDICHLLNKAAELADEVLRIKAEDSQRPVYFLAKSGGTGLALLAAERLPPATLERIILLSSAVSPTCDLRPALRATRREIVSYWSPHDKFWLGWGTTTFGTIDRVYGPSAGLCGFQVPADLSAADRELYRRLVQVPWHPVMLLQGYAGRHAGTSLPGFVRRTVAPWLLP